VETKYIDLCPNVKRIYSQQLVPAYNNSSFFSLFLIIGPERLPLVFPLIFSSAFLYGITQKAPPPKNENYNVQCRILPPCDNTHIV